MDTNKSTQADVLTIDPLALGLVNRLAPGTVVRGEHFYQGGLLLQGHWLGSGVVAGNVLVAQSALLVGHFRVLGDLYVFGHLGRDIPHVDETLIECHGTTYMAHCSLSTATVLSVGLRLYEGARITGEMRTLLSENSADNPA